jgi:hypothetical protein
MAVQIANAVLGPSPPLTRQGWLHPQLQHTTDGLVVRPSTGGTKLSLRPPCIPCLRALRGAGWVNALRGELSWSSQRARPVIGYAHSKKRGLQKSPRAPVYQLTMERALPNKKGIRFSRCKSSCLASAARPVTGYAHSPKRGLKKSPRPTLPGLDSHLKKTWDAPPVPNDPVMDRAD